MSGRIADIEVDPTDTDTWWVAVGSGGVWKTENAGITWTPVFDKQPVYSVGDVTLDPSNTDIVWVGTGENNGGRISASATGSIAPTMAARPGRIWACRLPSISPTSSSTRMMETRSGYPRRDRSGHRWRARPLQDHRRGKSWRQVLKPDNEWTGVTSLVMDPANPDRLYAATWQRQRTVAAYVGTGPGSAIYSSDDGGETWSKLSVGLPKKNMGKIGLAISAATPDTVYAVIELDQRKGGVWRTTDRGASWTKMSDRSPAVPGRTITRSFSLTRAGQGVSISPATIPRCPTMAARPGPASPEEQACGRPRHGV